jgi:hypothetical protein
MVAVNGLDEVTHMTTLSEFLNQDLAEIRVDLVFFVMTVFALVVNLVIVYIHKKNVEALDDDFPDITDELFGRPEGEALLKILEWYNEISGIDVEEVLMSAMNEKPKRKPKRVQTVDGEWLDVVEDVEEREKPESHPPRPLSPPGWYSGETYKDGDLK